MQNPTREQVEKIVCQLEHGIDAFALSTGMAAITLLMEIFKPGDHLIVDSDLYGGTIRLFDNVSVKNGINFTRANCSVDDLEALIKPQTKAIFIETPSNPMMNVTDIKKVARITKKHKLLLIVDNTFMSPYFQNPLPQYKQHGALPARSADFSPFYRYLRAANCRAEDSS